jgi:hypothetical protein
MFRVTLFTIALLAFGPEARAEFSVSPGFTVKAKLTYTEAKALACYERRPLAVWVGMDPIDGEAPANAVHVRVVNLDGVEGPALVIGEPWPGKDDLFLATIRLFRAGVARTVFRARGNTSYGSTSVSRTVTRTSARSSGGCSNGG